MYTSSMTSPTPPYILSMKPLSLHHAILSTISFFNTLSYPVTIAEIEEFILFYVDDVKTIDIIQALAELREQGHIESSNGMYTLHGRKEIVGERLAKYAPCEKKYRIAMRASRFLAHIPFVRMICVVNSLAIHNAHQESDIDLFIVTKQKHIWITRCIVVALLDFMKKRPKENMKKNMICTCFFAAEDALDFSYLQIPPSSDGGVPDLYLAWWVSRFVPMYDEGGYAEKLFHANEWAKKIFFRRRLYRTVKEHRVFLNFFGIVLKRMGEFLIMCTGRASENLAKALQMRILPESLRAIHNRDTRVVMNDQILKFHIRDMRQQVRTKFFETCKNYGIHFLR